MREFTGQMPRPKVADFVRARAVEAHMDIAILWENFRQERSKANGVPWSKPDLTTYRKNTSVWTHCLRKTLLGLRCALSDFHFLTQSCQDWKPIQTLRQKLQTSGYSSLKPSTWTLPPAKLLEIYWNQWSMPKWKTTPYHTRSRGTNGEQGLKSFFRERHQFGPVHLHSAPPQTYRKLHVAPRVTHPGLDSYPSPLFFMCLARSFILLRACGPFQRSQDTGTDHSCLFIFLIDFSSVSVPEQN